MYPWDVLCIDETDDKKTIKKAYAQLIKKYRPDEDPEKFQEIHQAYQYALDLLRNGQQAVAHPSVTTAYPQSRVNKVIEEQQEVLNDAQMDPDNELIEEETFLDDSDHDSEVLLGNHILEQFHQMAFTDYLSKKKVENWSFINQYHEIQDLQLRDSLSKELFKRVAEYNFFQQKENKTLLLTQPMAREIADLLGWESQWQEFKETFPEEYVQHVFSLIDSNDPYKSSLKILLGRPACILLELIIVAVFITAVTNLHEYSSKLLVLLLVYVGFSLGASLSSLNLSAFQYLAGYRLYDKYLNQPQLKNKAIRSLAFHLTFIPFYLIPLVANEYVYWCQLFVTILVLMNFLLWLKYQQFLK